MSAERSVSIRVWGKVQGVWFRASAKSVANKLHIKGYVSNMPDGSVYIEACGSPEAIESMISWCNHGPELSRVEKIDVTDLAPLNYTTFQVKRG